MLESSYRRLFSFIPRQVTDSRSLSCDPLPPPSVVTKYDAEFFEGVDDTFGISGAGTARGRLAQFIQQDGAVLQQIQVSGGARQEIKKMLNRLFVCLAGNF